MKETINSPNYLSFLVMGVDTVSGKSFRWTFTDLDADDSTITDQYDAPGTVANGILFLDDLPINIMNPILNERINTGSFEIKLVAKRVQINTPKGTFFCNKFQVFEDGDLLHTVLADEEYRFPFVQLDNGQDGILELIE